MEFHDYGSVVWPREMEFNVSGIYISGLGSNISAFGGLVVRTREGRSGQVARHVIRAVCPTRNRCFAFPVLCTTPTWKYGLGFGIHGQKNLGQGKSFPTRMSGNGVPHQESLLCLPGTLHDAHLELGDLGQGWEFRVGSGYVVPHEELRVRCASQGIAALPFPYFARRPPALHEGEGVRIWGLGSREYGFEA